ncbi:S9 family peptidase [Saccharobesus litoralis]|uniref:S9 family peptidase n=1 Tax=Saccharobesus litoralis TaxID=2172099 RepID=A0A2S0VWL8_9ALTE|nr:S9 family peptidase [Saccharobesus litoralis]AWB68611.1 S9 family peptidase [Saccharobesus litoralis]
MRITRIFTVFLALISMSVLAQSPKHLPLEAYGTLPEVSMVRISPSGKRVAMRYTKDDKDLLFVREVASGKTISGVNLSGITAEDAYFIDETRIIIRASEYRAIFGYQGKHDVSTAFVFDADTKKMRQLLIPGYGIYRGQTGLGSIVGLSPDKEYAYMPAYLGDDNRMHEVPKMTLTRVTLNKKRKPRAIKKGTADAIDFFVDEKGEILVRERFNNEKNLHRIQRYDDGEWVDIFSETTPYRTKGFVGLTPDRQSLVMIANGQNGRDAYYTMAIKDGSITGPLFSREDADVERVLTDIQRIVYGVQYSGFKPTYAFFDKKLEKVFTAIQQAMPDNSFRIDDYTPDWQQILFYMEGESSSGDYFLFTNNDFVHVASARPQVDASFVNPVLITEYKARDGLTIPALVTTPKVAQGKPSQLPAIMFPHGGPESYDKYGFHWLAQYFANRGFVVIQPQFRGSEGFGAEHVLKGRGEWGKKMQDDLTDGVNHLAQQGMIDPDRVCIVGISYGGYAALAGATFTPEVYKCVVSINGVSDVEEMIDDEKREYGSDHWVVAYWKDVIDKQKLGDDFLESISPINHVKKVKAPILLVHGEDDSVVPFEQSDDMYDELDDEDKEVTFVELEDEGHSLLKNKTRLQTLKAIDKFIHKHI